MYSFDATIRYSECDERRLLTLPALINLLQDCSTFHSEVIGHGVDYLAEHHFAWVITNWNIHILETPRFLDEVRVSTWCPEIGAVSARRNFTIDAPDRRLVEADSMWVVFDTDRGRAVRVPRQESVFASDDPPLAIEPQRRKIKPEGTGEPLDPIVVTKHHLDTNHHVNNGQYVAMAHDAVLQVDEGFLPSRLHVQYRMAARLGDVIHPWVYREEGAWCVDLTDADGARFAICRLFGA
jgi:acyl-ACP thioesterase